MSTTPNTPESQPAVHEVSPTPRWIILVLVVLLVAVAGLVYAGYSARNALRADLTAAQQKTEMLEAQLEQAHDRLADLKGQFEVTSEKLGLTQQELARARGLAQTIRKEQKAADEQLMARLSETRETTEAKIGEVSAELSDAKTGLEEARQALSETASRLERTIGDLGVQSGLIARNREEVEELRRLGERNIYEFDLRKTRQPQEVGSVRIRLKKADTKRHRYTMDLVVEDKVIEKKDKTLYEPVQFYTGGRGRAPHEIVVFEITKDRIVGYLSTPKSAASASN